MRPLSLSVALCALADARPPVLAALNLLHYASPSHTDNPALACPCVVHRTFSGELRSKITCGRCHHQSETLEPFLDLSLDIRDRASGKLAETLKECLNRCASSSSSSSLFSMGAERES